MGVDFLQTVAKISTAYGVKKLFLGNTGSLAHPAGLFEKFEQVVDEYTREGHRQTVPEDHLTNDSLYQHGWCPFLPIHVLCLFTVLDGNSEEWEVGCWR